MTITHYPDHWRVRQRRHLWQTYPAMAGEELIELFEHTEDPGVHEAVLSALWTFSSVDVILCAILYEQMLDEREEMLRWP